jgi:hypothetical protein
LPGQLIHHEGTFYPDQEKTYFHLPLEVPPQAVKLAVEFQYSDRISSEPGVSGGNTLDLGVFDERGIDFLTAGFRGWSGSERAAFWITETEATPGYLAGKINPGKWHVLLGLYKIAPQGCAYQVTIRVETEDGPEKTLGRVERKERDPARQGELPSSQPPARSAPWLRGELHCHTHHSDGELSAAELVRLSVEGGLDYLAVADHNTIASQQELENLVSPGLILIRGVEVTSFKGHFNVWGVPDWVDFRITQPEEMEAALEFARQRGALVSCNHPKPFGPEWDFPQVTGFDCVEVWNGPWFLFNQQALEYWLSLLASGRRIPAVAGSDFHRLSEIDFVVPRAPGIPVTWVYVTGKQDAESILQAIAAGHASLSDSPDGIFLEIKAGMGLPAMAGDLLPRPPDGRLPVQVRCLRGAGGSLRILDQRGAVLEQQITQEDELVSTSLNVAESLYLRAELRQGEDLLHAMTNPIYLSP